MPISHLWMELRPGLIHARFPQSVALRDVGPGDGASARACSSLRMECRIHSTLIPALDFRLGWKCRIHGLPKAGNKVTGLSNRPL